MADEKSHEHAALGKALGRLPSGVYILTVAHGGKSTAMLASWVQQAGFEPPAVSVAVAKGRPVGDMIRESKRFVLSIIAAGDQSLMKRYARGVDPDADAFAGVATIPTTSGAPALSDALGFLECELLTACDFGGDHELLIARITGGRILRDGAAFAHQRGNGFHY
jgi:flavin reductase (DIM6/NTAB) family NADH-FMN oxidoreductase RutF